MTAATTGVPAGVAVVAAIDRGRTQPTAEPVLTESAETRTPPRILRLERPRVRQTMAHPLVDAAVPSCFDTWVTRTVSAETAP